MTAAAQKGVKIIFGDDEVIFKSDSKSSNSSEFYQDTGIVPYSHKTELSEAMKRLDDDSVDHETGMTEFDKNANLNYLEKTMILVVDTLIGYHFLPLPTLRFTRQNKRLSVSVDALGRRQKVDMVVGQRDHETKRANLIDRAMNAFTGDQNSGGGTQ